MFIKLKKTQNNYLNLKPLHQIKLNPGENNL